jgi:hypothetical protein
MLLRDMGYNIYHLKDVKEIIDSGKKINMQKDRKVVIAEEKVYKTINEGMPAHFLEVVACGYYKRCSPNLFGFICDGENWVGYVQGRCQSLNIMKHDMNNIRKMLCDLYLDTALIHGDSHTKNFGKWNGQLVALDLESVVKTKYTKDQEYQRFINENEPRRNI